MRVILLASALAVLSTSAFAAAPWTATPAQPINDNGFVGQSVVWNCNASGCASQSDTGSADAMGECRGVAREVGTLTSFIGDHPFDAAHLAACNQWARKR
jgi:hypothetical protein